MRVQIEPTEQIDRLAFTPDMAALVSGRTRTRVFAAIRNGELAARKDGKPTVIEREELLRWIRTFPVIGRSFGDLSTDQDRIENASEHVFADPNRHLVEVPDSFAIARWSRDADVATIARCILGTLKYEPHAIDTSLLRRALEGVIEHTARGGSVPLQAIPSDQTLAECSEAAR